MPMLPTGFRRSVFRRSVFHRTVFHRTVFDRTVFGSAVFGSPHPRRVAAILGGAEIALTVVGALVVSAVAPSASPWTSRLIVVLALAVAVTAVLAATRSWQRAGFTARVGSPALLVLPALIALAPLVGGVHPPAADLLTILVIGYAATAFVEEALYRGVILGILRPCGVWPAVFISSGLFGAAHLANVLFGQPAAVTVAQAVGAFCFGVGYAALRLRTGSILPLMVLHFLTDLLLRVDALPGWAHWTLMVGGDTLLLVYGLLLLRGRAAVDAPAH